MKKCCVCGEEIDSGYVVHRDCMDKLKAADNEGLNLLQIDCKEKSEPKKNVRPGGIDREGAVKKLLWAETCLCAWFSAAAWIWYLIKF